MSKKTKQASSPAQWSSCSPLPAPALDSKRHYVETPDPYGPMEHQYAPGTRAAGTLTDGDPLVPYLIQDRTPVHYGAGATVAVITGVLRLAEIGYRLQFCDLLSDLIEGDPATRNVCSTRVKAVAGRPWNIVPAETAPDDEQGEREAKIIADYCKGQIKRIPRWKTHVAGLLWGIYSGVSTREVMWERLPDGEMRVKKLRLVPSRRLGYNWDWQLCWSEYGQTNNGIPLESFPGKFLTFEPSTWDDLPTREGIGRTLLYWLGFKRFGSREFVAFIERFGKPYPQVSWKTGRDEADEKDIVTAKALCKDIGRGTMSGVAHPDTVTLNVTGNGSTNTSGNAGESTPHKALIQLSDEQIAKLVLGQAYTTNRDQGTGGLGGGSDVFADASQLIFVDDASQLEEAIDTGLLWWIVALNFGKDKADRYCPHYKIEIEDPEDADKWATRMASLAKVGQPIPIKYIAERALTPMPEAGDEILTADGRPGIYRTPEEREEAAAKIAAQMAGKGGSGGSGGSEGEDGSEGGEDEEKPAKPKPGAAKGKEGPAAEEADNKLPKSKPRPKKGVKGLPNEGGTPKRFMADVPLIPVPTDFGAVTQQTLDAWAAEAKAHLGLNDTAAGDEAVGDKEN